MSDNHRLDDSMQSALALTHHIQTRIIQCQARRSVSENIADDVKQKAKAIVDTFYKRAEGDTHD